MPRGHEVLQFSEEEADFHIVEPMDMDSMAVSGLAGALLNGARATLNYKKILADFYSDEDVLRISVEADRLAYPEVIND